jgi:hypothetical protein
MSNLRDEELQKLFQDSFDGGFDLGQSEEMAEMIGKPVSGMEMAHALHVAGAIAGLAIKLADMMGEDNANFALKQAAIAVAVHSEAKRNGN